MLKLYIGNKNYSSWSMRPWVMLRQAGIPSEEVLVRFDSFNSPDPAFRRTRPEEHPPELNYPRNLDSRLLLEKKKI